MRTKTKHYLLIPGREHSHGEMVTIPKIEYDQLKEIARLHKILLDRIEELLPTIIADYKKESGN